MLVSEFLLLLDIRTPIHWKIGSKAKEVVENPDELANPTGGGEFVERAMITFQALRIELGKSYRQPTDLLSQMPGILEEIGIKRLLQFTDCGTGSRLSRS